MSDSADFFPDQFPAVEKKRHQEIVREAAKILAKKKTRAEGKSQRKQPRKSKKARPKRSKAVAPPRFDPDLYEAAKRMEQEAKKPKKTGSGAVLVTERYDKIGGVPQKRYFRGVMLHERWEVPDFGGDARLEAHLTTFWEEKAMESSNRTLLWEDVESCQRELKRPGI